jgi:hypothetical protein
VKRFEIEHIGIAMKDPVRMANWYQEALGFNIWWQKVQHLSKNAPSRGMGENLVVLSDPWGNTIQLMLQNSDRSISSQIQKTII